MGPLTPEEINLLGQLFSGLQVPRSLGMLGAAQEPYDKLTRLWGLRGWLDPIDAMIAIQRERGKRSE